MSSLLMFVFAVMFLILSGRFLYIQGTAEVAGISLHDWADKKRTSSYELQAQRGTVYDRNGMELAQDRATYRIYAIVRESYTSDPKEPKHVENSQETAEMLAPFLNMETSEIVSAIEKAKDEELFQVEFGVNGKDLSQEQRDEIENLKLPGVEFIKESKRYYPNGMFASHVIGLAQKKEVVTKDEKGTEVKEFITKGVIGIEQQMDDALKGEDGRISYKRDKYNTKLLKPEEVIKEEQDGNDVYLTIDQKIQTLLEDAMSQVEEQYNPERMTAVVMDPNTGEILAMSNRPSYNPNQIGNVENWYNDVISSPFEPGSTMKIFTLAAAIEEGLYNPEEIFQSGKYRIDENSSINDWKIGGWGPITFREGIQRSSNVAAAILAYDKVGPEKFYEYLQAFRFDQPTGIDLPGELVGKLQYTYKSNKITASYGQGSTVTPIQQMMAASAIANDGNLVQPYIVSKVVNSETGDILQESGPTIVGNPVSAETAMQVRDELETVITSEKGTGQMYKLNDYSLAGKTGTAQIPDPEDPPYMNGNGNYIYSFLGMAPKDDPELMMYVSVKQPELSGNELGSEPVSFIFKTVMENSLHYLKIEPDNVIKEDIHTVKIPEIVGVSLSEAKERLENYDLQLVTIGTGNTVKMVDPPVNDEVLPNEKVILLTDDPKMPDLTGWSIRDVMRLGHLLNLEVEIKGSGYAISQSIEMGNGISSKNQLVVEFVPPNKEIDSNNSG
nr:penicillin-binding protein [Aquibacillus halophilus]